MTEKQNRGEAAGRGVGEGHRHGWWSLQNLQTEGTRRLGVRVLGVSEHYTRNSIFQRAANMSYIKTKSWWIKELSIF